MCQPRKILSVAVNGIGAFPIEGEVNPACGVTVVVMVGLPDTMVERRQPIEDKDTCRISRIRSISLTPLQIHKRAGNPDDAPLDSIIRSRWPFSLRAPFRWAERLAARLA